MVGIENNDVIADLVYGRVFDEQDSRCIHLETAEDIFGMNLDDFEMLFLSDIQEKLNLPEDSVKKIYYSFFEKLLDNFRFEQHQEDSTGAFYVIAS